MEEYALDRYVTSNKNMDRAGVLRNKMAYIFAITYRKTAETMNSMNERRRKTYFCSKKILPNKIYELDCDPPSFDYTVNIKQS